MTRFKYIAFHAGRKVSDFIEADDAQAARATLRERGLTPVSVEPAPLRGKTLRPRNAFDRALSRWLISQSSIEQTFMQLVVLLRGDVAVVEAFETAAGLAKGYLAQALWETAQSVRGGASLAKAMRTSMPWVGGLYLGLIAVGEANGALPRMFSYCVGLMENRRKLRNEIIRALTYPAIVVLMGLGVGYYVSTIAIPQIASVMGNPDALPPITRSLLTTSDWVKTQGYWLILGPVLFGVTVAVLRHVPGVGLALDRVGLSIPLFGKVGRFSGNALFNQTLAILLESGISVIESLALIRGTLSNAFYRRQIAAVRASVLAGKPLSEGIAASALNHLSPLSKALVRVGESSGNLADGLRYVGDFYAQALARRLDLLGKLVEPALVVVVGGMVAYVYIAFFMGMAAMNATAG